MADVLSELRSGLENPLRELEPLVEEHAQVRAALDALKGAGTRAERAAGGAAKRGRAAVPRGTSARRGRPRGSGSRAQEG
jgi:hypothetical protein